MCNKKTTQNITGKEGVMVTDSLATLCMELATLFSSISNITRTCLGIKEHLGAMQVEEVSDKTVMNMGEKKENTINQRKGSVVWQDNHQGVTQTKKD